MSLPASFVQRVAEAAVFVALLAASGLHAAGSDLDARVRAEYPDILTAWAAADVDALDRLAALEQSLVREKKAHRDIEEMWKSKLAVIRETIARGGSEVLVPIMLLHHDASRYYAAAAEVRLARHSRRMSQELAEFYAKNSESPRARMLAADLLASLGGHLQAGLVVRKSAELYYRALDIDGGNLAAHMGLASMFERRGELNPALEHYGRAAKFAPGSPEPVLRHAMVARRLEREEIALEDLDRVISMEAADWIRRIALQEKAKILQSGKGVEAALAAYHAYPDSSRQAIQMSLFLERQRRPREALAVLDGIGDEEEAESERYFYTRWPSAALEESRARLRQASGEQGRVLASAAAVAPVATEAQGR